MSPHIYVKLNTTIVVAKTIFIRDKKLKSTKNQENKEKHSHH